MSKETAVAHVHTEREIIHHCPEHKVWLSFRDDAAAEDFDWWWNKTGQHLWFAHYVEQRAIAGDAP